MEAELSTERSPAEVAHRSPAEVAHKRADSARASGIPLQRSVPVLEAASPDRGAAARNRDSHFRRLLASADLLVCGSVLLATSYASATSQGLEPAALLALPVFLLLAKMLGLYDRDELVLQQDVPGTAGLEIDADVSIGNVEIRHA